MIHAILQKRIWRGCDLDGGEGGGLCCSHALKDDVEPIIRGAYIEGDMRDECSG